MDSLALQALVSKLSAMAAAGARVAAGSGAVGPAALAAAAAATGGAQRGLRTAAAVGSALAGQQHGHLQTRAQQQRVGPLYATPAAVASYASAAPPAHQPQQFVNLAGAAAVPPPVNLGAAAHLAGRAHRRYKKVQQVGAERCCRSTCLQLWLSGRAVWPRTLPCSPASLLPSTH